LSLRSKSCCAAKFSLAIKNTFHRSSFNSMRRRHAASVIKLPVCSARQMGAPFIPTDATGTGMPGLASQYLSACLHAGIPIRRRLRIAGTRNSIDRALSRRIGARGVKTGEKG
jgi:hypothetical protein